MVWPLCLITAKSSSIQTFTVKCLIFQKAGVKVFVLLYKELEIALTINSHYSKHALMNKCPENIKVC